MTDPRRPGILDLLGRYADAVLRADASRFAPLWEDDAEWVIPGTSTIVGRDAIVDTFVRVRAGFPLCVQEVLSGYLDEAVVDDEASAHWQVRELQWRPDRPGSQLIGVYHDDVRASRGRWRFARRRFEVVYRGPADLSGRVFVAAPGA